MQNYDEIKDLFYQQIIRQQQQKKGNEIRSNNINRT
jgi:hypothetical protein